MNVFEVLNKLKWTGELKDAEISIIHRGAEKDRKIIPGDKITMLKRHYFYYRNGDETFIPLHRIIEVRTEGRLLWKKSERSARD